MTHPDRSIPKAAPWMAGGLLPMTLIAVAGREATRSLSAFQVRLLRSAIGLVLIARPAGGAGIANGQWNALAGWALHAEALDAAALAGVALTRGGNLVELQRARRGRST